MSACLLPYTHTQTPKHICTQTHVHASHMLAQAHTAFIWGRTFRALAVSPGFTVTHPIQLPFLCGVYLQILAGENTFLALSKGNECKRDIPPWRKKDRGCMQGFLSPWVPGYSILEVPGCWKTIGGSQLPDFLSPPCPPNNRMLEAFKDPDIRITRVTSLNG